MPAHRLAGAVRVAVEDVFQDHGVQRFAGGADFAVAEAAQHQAVGEVLDRGELMWMTGLPEALAMVSWKVRSTRALASQVARLGEELVDAQQVGPVLLGGVGRGQAGGFGLQHDAGAHELPGGDAGRAGREVHRPHQVLRRVVADEAAAFRRDLDEPAFLQGLECFPDDGAADGELGRQVAFGRQADPGAQPPVRIRFSSTAMSVLRFVADARPAVMPTTVAAGRRRRVRCRASTPSHQGRRGEDR